MLHFIETHVMFISEVRHTHVALLTSNVLCPLSASSVREADPQLGLLHHILVLSIKRSVSSMGGFEVEVSLPVTLKACAKALVVCSTVSFGAIW